MVNAVRAEHGVGPVRLNSSMSAVAASWSQAMADAGTMSHNLDYSTQIPSGWSRAAENVAWNSPPDVAGLQSAWMGSPGHRANILDPAFTDIGVGVVIQGGSAWGTQVFGAYGAPLPAAAPPPPAAVPAPAPVPARPPAPDQPPGPAAAPQVAEAPSVSQDAPSAPPQASSALPEAPSAPTPSVTPSGVQTVTPSPSGAARADPRSSSTGGEGIGAALTDDASLVVAAGTAGWLATAVALALLLAGLTVLVRRRRRSGGPDSGPGAP